MQLLAWEVSAHYKTIYDLYAFKPPIALELFRAQTSSKPEPPLLPTQGIFDLPHHIGMVWKELAFKDAVSYTQGWEYS